MEKKLFSKLKELKLASFLEYCNTSSLKVGNTDVPMLVFDNQQKSKKKLLVTAGSDGDELDGIVAAMRMMKRFSHMNIDVRVLVLPILNPSAFINETDYTPEDNKFLKLYYPGDKGGSYTLRLIDQIRTTYVKETNIWIDLHGGNAYEDMTPFMGGYVTDYINLNNITKTLLSNLKNDLYVYETSQVWEKVDNLADDGIIYFISEAGDGLKQTPKMQGIHISRIEKVLELMEGKLTQRGEVIESKVQMISVKKNRRWIPHVSAGEVLNDGDVIGQVRGRFGTRAIKTNKKMQVLWIRKESKLEINQAVCGAVFMSC